MGSYAGVDCNLTLCPLQNRTMHGQPYATIDLNPMPQSTLSPSQGLRIWPLQTHVIQRFFCLNEEMRKALVVHKKDILYL
jgi:hypothetical protein